MNVIGNAIKFTFIGSIKVMAWCTTDVPSADYNPIFKPFVQVDGALARKFGSTGLGLKLSRQLARNLGGDIEIVQSEVEKWSIFQVKLLNYNKLTKKISSESENLNSCESELTADSLDGVHVLVVDDSTDNRNLLGDFLRKYKAVVDFAENGFDCYQKAPIGNFDVVLMNIEMHVMNVYTASQKLREVGYRKLIGTVARYSGTLK